MAHHFVDGFFSSGATHIRTRTRTQTTGHGHAQLHTGFAQRALYGLCIRIANNKLAALKAGAYHIIDGITASATDANYCYSWGQFLHLFVLHSDVNHGGESSIGFDLL
jgi:hypothetical protein